MTSSVAEKLARKSATPKSAARVRLNLVHIDLWSAVKVSFIAGIGVALLSIVCIYLIWASLDQSGAFVQFDSLLANASGQATISTKAVFTVGHVMTFAMIIGAIDVVVATVAGIVAAWLYNLSVKVTSGISIGLSSS